ncbi:MAG: hypothetical protein PHE06_14950 [Lachnospiraceae bacterium]|nr:hypothetical protein [Lachnospiraceae bacterium]MDD3797232.1 hypothetical protein [Lachnospiraceae bacterium]
MKTVNFSNHWTCQHPGDTNTRNNVTLPHDAMLSEPRTANAPGGASTGWFEGFDYVYEKMFDVPVHWAEQCVIFEFEGIYRHARVYLNGQEAAFCPYGYSGFYVEANPFLNFGGGNTIRVIARNADQPNSRWYSGAGIYRPVWLHLLPMEHISMDGIKIRTLSYEKPEIQVSVDRVGDGSVRVEILGGDPECSGGTGRRRP